MKHLIGLMALTAGLWGCAAKYTEPKLGEEHPGNPAAQEGIMSARPSTLETTNAAASSEQADMENMQRGEHANGHGSTTQGEAIYACPMHPEVTSNDPNARCPKCGMKLEKRNED